MAALPADVTQERFNFAGTHSHSPRVPMELHPLQQPYPPLWYPTHTPSSIEYAGRHGFNFVGLGPAAAMREHTEAYRRAWGGHKHHPAPPNRPVRGPKNGHFRPLLVAARRTAAAAASRA